VQAGFFGTARVGDTRYVHEVEALDTETLQQEMGSENHEG
jgi:hypothetical protein